MVGPNVAIRKAGVPKQAVAVCSCQGVFAVRSPPRAVGENPTATILTMIVFADGSKVTDRADPPHRVTRTGNSNGASPGWDCTGLLDLGAVLGPQPVA